MTAYDILLSLPDHQQLRAGYAINARQQQDATPEGNLSYHPCSEASRRGFGVITPSLARGDVRRKHWREYNQKRGGHDG